MGRGGFLFTMTIKKRFGSSNCEDRCDCLFALPRYQARVEVQLRPSVLDPAGEATRSAAARLGIEGLQSLRIGKAIVLSLEAADAKQAEAQVGVLCDRLLANPVTENWSISLEELQA